MKTIYKLLILGIVYLVSNITQAQIIQYSEDGTKGCIDCEEKTGTDSDCFCYFFEDVPRFHEVLAKIEAEKREEWLRGKEKILKGVIEDRLSTTYTSYTEAQRAFLKAYSAESYSKSILNDLENNISATQRPKEIEKDKNYYEIRTIEKLFKYNNEGTAYKFGDLKMNGKYLRDIPNQDAVRIHTGLDNKKKEIADQLVGISRILQGIPKIRQNKALEERIINDFMNHYNGHDFLNRVLLMAKYLIWQNNGHIVGNNPANDPYPPTVFNPNLYDYLGVARDLALNAGQSASVSYPQATDDQAIASYAISTFGDKEFDFITSNFNVLNKARSYLIYHKYSKDGLDLADDLFSSYVNNTPFPHQTYNYKASTTSDYGIYFQEESNKNRAFELRNFKGTDNIRVYEGLNNMLSALENSSQNTEHIGQFAIEMLKDNGVVIPITITALQAYSLFNFRETEYIPRSRRFNIPVSFRNNIGTILWDNNLRFPSFLENPIEMDAISAYQANDLPQFEHLLRVRDLAKSLSLNNAQTDWLIDNRVEAVALHNFYTANSDQQGMNFAREALDAYQNGNFVDLDLKMISNLTGTEGCLHELLAENGNNFIKNIMSKFQGETYFSITLNSVPNLTNDGKGVNGLTIYTHNSKNIEIKLNSTTAISRPSLAVAKTIIHEYIHADMRRKLNTPGVPTIEFLNFKSVYDYWIEKNIPGEKPKEQHETMAQLYVGEMAKTLKDFHKNVLTADYNKFIDNFGTPPTDTFYEAVAWEGLKESDIQGYKDLTAERKTELNNEYTKLGYLTKGCPNN